MLGSRTLSFAALLSCAGLPCLSAANVGDEAPELTPSEWLNTRVVSDWASLKGRVILVEKWATT